MARLSIIFFILSIYFGCDFVERSDSNFKNYNEAIESDSWKGNWLPKQLPEDAINIYESHYIDDTRTIVAFEFHGNFGEQLKKDCKKTDGFNNIKLASMNAKWWPNSLVGNGFASSHEYYYYVCSETEYFAIPFDKKEAYFWRL